MSELNRKGPFRVVYDGRENLTVDITDEKRADVAYNTLYGMADLKTHFEFNGPFGGPFGGSFAEEFSKDKLSVIDSEGNVFKPELDPEFYGNEDAMGKVYNALIDKIIAEAMDDEEISRSEAANRMVPHIFHFPVEDGIVYDNVYPTHDPDKAAEMYNFLKYGLADDLVLSARLDDENQHSLGDRFLDTDKLMVVDTSGQKIEIVDDPEWAYEYIDEGLAFDEAVRSLSNEEGKSL